MNPIVIDEACCTGCGLCVNDCFTNALYLEGGKARAKADSCAECGHCYAICPQGAVSMPGYDCDGGGLVSYADFDAERMLRALKSRRTIRRFRDQPVEKEQLRAIIEAGRYSPTAINLQNVRYTVLSGERMAEFERVSVAALRKAMRLAKRFSPMLESMRIEDDFLFHGAPAAILVTASKEMIGYFLADVNGSLATAHMETQAECMGLGVLISG